MRQAARFQGEAFPAAPRAAARQPIAAAAAQSSQCARHPRNAAVAACDECGAFLCTLCKVDWSGRAVCTACFEKLSAPGGLGTRPLRSYRSLAVGAAVCGFFLWPLALLFAPVVLFATAASRRQARAWGDEPLPAVWHLYLFGAGELLVGAGWVLSMMSVFK